MMVLYNRRSVVPLGFTLIELLVVLVIVSVMVGLVGPRVIGSISNTSLKTASKRIAASLRYARSQAISESRIYEILFDLDGDRMVIKGPETSGEHTAADGIEGDDHNPPSIYPLPGDVQFEKAIWRDEESDSGEFRILFVPNGGSSGGDLLICNDRGHRYRIKVDVITGTVTVREEDKKI